MRKQAEKKQCKRQQGIYHRLIRRTADEYVVLTNDTEPAAKKNSHRLNRCPGLNRVGSTDDRAPDDPTKSNTNIGQLSRGTTKPTSQAPDEPTSTTTKHQCSCPKSLQNQSPRAPIKSTSRKIYTPVKRAKQQQKWLHRLNRCMQNSCTGATKQNGQKP